MKNVKPRPQIEKKIDGSGTEYIGGTGIEVSGNTIKLKPAKTGWYGEKDEILGGVWSDNYGVKIEDDGRIHLTSPMEGALGGIFSPRYGLYTLGGELRADLGKGMMFYTPKDAPTGHVNFVISPRLGDGLRMEPEEEDDNEEIPIPGTGREKSESAIQLYLGDGLEFGKREYFNYRYGVLEKTGFTSKLRVKLGKGLSFGANGEINATGSGEYKEYKAGENIEISSDGTISAIVKEYTAGENITISEDGKISSTGGGAELMAGGGITVETDGETGLQTISAAVGEGAEIRGGKICTVPNIQNAVLITEADAKYILHDFSQVEYIAGNKIGYTGPGNQIVLQGTVCYKYGGIAPNGKTVGNASNKDPSELPDIPLYASLDFDPAIGYSNNFFVEMKVNFVRATNLYIIFQIVGVEEDQNEILIALANVYDSNGVRFALMWNEINAPSDTYPFGYAKALIGYRYLGASNTYQMTVITSLDFTVPFASIAEYQAAVGLTYEPLTLTEVVDNPTVVSGKSIGEGVT